MLRATVDFSKKLQEWDGFGVNYAEAAQTRDYRAAPQDYGGFSTLPETSRQEILDLIFGADGLKPGLVKMFLDPWHQPALKDGYAFDVPEVDLADYDHTTTTEWMRYFAAQGQEKVREWGGGLEVIVTLYGPPAWMTRQGFVRGRDLDPAYKFECAKYMISWAKYLREGEDLNVRYISFHNEGEDWTRWPQDGAGPGAPNHDYNLYWPPAQVADFLRFMREMLDTQGMGGIGLTPGETSNWYRFHAWGYADAIADDPMAMKNLGLITSHGFANASPGRRFGDWRSAGNDILRAKQPDLHSWATSLSWGRMDVHFVNEIRQHIYSAKVNAVIPWATVQRHSLWVGGDPNPGTAFRVDDDGHYAVEPGYHYFKQVSRVGQPGTAVCRVTANSSDIGLIAFGSHNTGNPDAFVLLNLAEEPKTVPVEVAGSAWLRFAAHRTAPDERYEAVGDFDLPGGMLEYEAPPLSVTTFVGH